MTYSEKLKDPRWQRTSALVKERAGWKCERCGCSKKTLHAHHRLYEPNREPWDYALNNFECLCRECHEVTEKLLKKMRYEMADMTCDDLRRLIRIVHKTQWDRVDLLPVRKRELKIAGWKNKRFATS